MFLFVCFPFLFFFGGFLFKMFSFFINIFVCKTSTAAITWMLSLINSTLSLLQVLGEAGYSLLY